MTLELYIITAQPKLPKCMQKDKAMLIPHSNYYYCQNLGNIWSQGIIDISLI